MRNPPQSSSARPGSHSYGVPFSYGGSPPGGRIGSQRVSQSYAPDPDLPPPPPQALGPNRSSYGEAQQQPYSYGGLAGPGGPRPSYTAQPQSGPVGGGYNPAPAATSSGYPDRNSGYNDRSSGYRDNRSSGYSDRNSAAAYGSRNSGYEREFQDDFMYLRQTIQSISLLS